MQIFSISVGQRMHKTGHRSLFGRFFPLAFLVANLVLGFFSPLFPSHGLFSIVWSLVLVVGFPCMIVWILRYGAVGTWFEDRAIIPGLEVENGASSWWVRSSWDSDQWLLNIVSPLPYWPMGLWQGFCRWISKLIRPMSDLGKWALVPIGYPIGIVLFGWAPAVVLFTHENQRQAGLEYWFWPFWLYIYPFLLVVGLPLLIIGIGSAIAPKLKAVVCVILTASYVLLLPPVLTYILGWRDYVSLLPPALTYILGWRAFDTFPIRPHEALGMAIYPGAVAILVGIYISALIRVDGHLERLQPGRQKGEG